MLTSHCNFNLSWVKETKQPDKKISGRLIWGGGIYRYTPVATPLVCDGCYNSPQLLVSQLWHCGDQFLLFLHQNAPDRMLKVKNFQGVIPPEGRNPPTRGRHPVRPYLDPPVFAMADRNRLGAYYAIRGHETEWTYSTPSYPHGGWTELKSQFIGLYKANELAVQFSSVQFISFAVCMPEESTAYTMSLGLLLDLLSSA